MTRDTPPIQPSVSTVIPDGGTPAWQTVFDKTTDYDITLSDIQETLTTHRTTRREDTSDQS